MTKPTWIFVAGTYRSGSTTQYQITRDIVEQTNNGVGIGYHTEQKLKDFDKPEHKFVVCKVFEPLFEGFRGEPSYAKKFFDEQRVKAIVTIRDPRDIIVSMKKREEGRKPDGKNGKWSFRATATTNFPLWLGWLQKWIDEPGLITHVAHYEEMTNGLRNLCTEVEYIARYLKVGITPEHVKEIASNYTISAMNKRKRDLKGTDQKEDQWLPSVPAIAFGTSGHYQTWLSQPEIKMIEISNHDFMKRWGYL